MALSKHEPRRFKRPVDDEEVETTALVGGRVHARRASPRPKATLDRARRALVDVLDVRGKPIRRDRGMKPSMAFQRAAGAYLMAHHYSFCVQFARSRQSRHIPLEDMIQACLTGAYIALERFDPDHETAYRFLSYAKWYLLCECNRLIHKDEALVVVPQSVKDARAALARTCPADLTDAEAAEILGLQITDVHAARGAHLGHEHRVVDERSRACRRTLGEIREAHDERAAALRAHSGIDAALAHLDPIARGVLYREYGVGHDERAPEPRSEAATRAIRSMALRRLRELLEESDED